MAGKRYRVTAELGPISLRKSPDREDPKWEEWYEWAPGDVFAPPAHLKTIRGLTLAECVAQGWIEEVKSG